jgi:hypothetical protein
MTKLRQLKPQSKMFLKGLFGKIRINTAFFQKTEHWKGKMAYVKGEPRYWFLISHFIP